MNSIIYQEEVDGPDFQLSVISRDADDSTFLRFYFSSLSKCVNWCMTLIVIFDSNCFAYVISWEFNY